MRASDNATHAQAGRSEEHWGDYWVDAGLHGCTAQFPEAVQREVAARWRALFATLPDGATLLDIGCGKGALLDLAGATGALARGIQATGVDLAPAATLSGEGFDIHGGIDAAALPFADRSFDCVVSQFGIEYAGFKPALAEAARVCAGQLVVLSHAAEGVVTEQAAEQAAQIDELLGPSRVAERLRTAQEDGSIDAVIATLRDELAAMIGEATNTGILDQLYVSFGEIARVAPLMPPAELAAAIDFMVTQLGRHRVRMGALADAAVRGEMAESATAMLTAAGFETTMSAQLSGGGDVVGYWLVARRNDADTLS
ncbi:class I SAM-dependent methyltransferase [Sphingoaurantiacus capsulatus]|uniref:Class I SAM-dependent methyltransferase n=1 Tax=Sphingoaurantiacus capsulatus TaxID=1771310 RepID=A0ABV7XC29_9SPHN